MAAPEYVPAKPMDDPRVYVSPPRRPDPWCPGRPGDLEAGQPRGPEFGYQGPDQGYALRLARHFHDKLILTPGEHHEDAVTGGVGVALKRASLFGRAPVIHDLTVAFSVYGFLSDVPPADLLALRKWLFAEVRHPIHYVEQRRIVDLVPDDTLWLTPTEVLRRVQTAWRDLLDATELAEIETVRH